VSTLAVDTITKADRSGALTVPAESGTVVTTASPSLGGRNLIINGAMQVAQRGTSTTDVAGYQSLDRYYVGSTGYTIAQSTEVPANTVFEYSLSSTRPTATSHFISQYIELPATGKAGVFWNGNTVTISAYVKGVNGATFNIKPAFSTGSGGSTGAYWGTTTTLDADGTWQRYEATYSVDQNVGASDTSVRFLITYNATATNETFYITGVQLEVGSVATPFEHRSYGEELALCQRYYYKLAAEDTFTNFFQASWRATTDARGVVPFPVTMRAIPSISTSGSITSLGHGTYSSIQLADAGSKYQGTIRVNGSGATVGYSTTIRANNDSTAAIIFDAEL